MLRPIFTPGLHVKPDCVWPLLALSDVMTDPVTGLPYLTVVNVHRTDGLDADGDVALDADDAGMTGWYAGLWSKRHVLASAVDTEAPLGMVSAATAALLKKKLAGETLSDEEYSRCSSGLGRGNAHPVVQYRRRILLDYHTLSADLLRRAEFTVDAASVLCGFIPNGALPARNGCFVGFDRMLNYFVETYAADPRIIQTVREKARAHETMRAFPAGWEPKSGDVGSMLIAAAWHCDTYLHSGMPADRTTAIEALKPLRTPQARFTTFLVGISWPAVTRKVSESVTLPLQAGDTSAAVSRCLISPLPLKDIAHSLSGPESIPPHCVPTHAECISRQAIDRRMRAEPLHLAWMLKSPPAEFPGDGAAAVLHAPTGTLIGYASVCCEDGVCTVAMNAGDVAWDALPDEPICTPEDIILIIGSD